MKSIMKNWIIILLFALGIFVPVYSISLLREDNSIRWRTEVAKSLMGLALTAIVGGFIKLAFDEKVKRDVKEKLIQESRNELLNRLRSVFDRVDSSRLLIEAHKSAKTYGEQIRSNVISSIPSLFDIKRSLVDAKWLADKKSLPFLRIGLHYMIAYLKVLSEEYKDGYLKISNLQFFQEAAREKQKEQFKIQYAQSKEKGFDIPNEQLDFTWKEIIKSKFLKDFLSDKPDAMYYKYFIDPYEHCKKILKGTLSVENRSLWFESASEYLETLEKIDAQKLVGSTQESDNLVNIIMRAQLGYEAKKISDSI